jgi:hypothetical protein
MKISNVVWIVIVLASGIFSVLVPSVVRRVQIAIFPALMIRLPTLIKGDTDVYDRWLRTIGILQLVLGLGMIWLVWRTS